jgi:hypothetical protein
METRVEGGRYLLHFIHCHIGWEMCVQRLFELEKAVTPFEVNRCHLPLGMHACIRTSCQQDGVTFPAHLAQSFFQLTLNSACSSLPLTSVEISAIVSDDNLVTYHLAAISTL